MVVLLFLNFFVILTKVVMFHLCPLTGSCKKFVCDFHETL